MIDSTVEVVSDVRSDIGECPTWWSDAEELERVDIAQGLVHVWDQDRGELSARTRKFAGEVSAVVRRKSGGHLVAVGNELLAVDAAGAVERTWRAEIDTPDNRFNDCRADPSGRLWAGTMSRTRTQGTAGLYRLDLSGELVRMLEGTTMSNGMGWSPDGSLMYFIDSLTYQVDVFDFEPGIGAMSNRRPFALIDRDHGLPDGLCVDAEGGVWVCLFGGGAVRRYSPDGRIDAQIELPVTNPTCPAIGGSNNTTLFITSARIRLSLEQLAAEPAGALLKVNVGVRGQAATYFAA